MKRCGAFLLALLGGLAAACAAADAPVTAAPADGEVVAVRTWLVSEPFPSPRRPEPPPEGPTGTGFDTDFLVSLGGEASARPGEGAVVAGPDGAAVRFSAHTWDDRYIDLNKIFNIPRGVCVYLYAELESPVEQTVYLHLATNSAGKAWLGGRLVLSHARDRVAAPSQDIVRATLAPGRTPLLLKVDHDGGGWGAYAEVYGRSAHQTFSATHFPSELTLEANNYVPEPGGRVSISVTNWIWPEPDASVTWNIEEGAGTTTLDARTEQVEVAAPASPQAISGGPPRLVRVRASAPRPQGGNAAGEVLLLAGGGDAALQTLRDFEQLRTAVGEPRTLEGPHRDAYAQALYAVERIAPKDVEAFDAAKGAEYARLREALDCFAAEKNPWADRDGTFDAAYLSEADGTAQPFRINAPSGGARGRRLALLIDLHGAGYTHELPLEWWRPRADRAFERDTIGVCALGRGRYGSYIGLAEQDILEVIGWIEAHYPVDPDRVYLMGGSMGGMGTWHIGGRYADRFAAMTVDCGWPSWPTLPNLLHVPTYVNHGDQDWAVPVVGARLGVELLERLGSPVVYTEYPGVDHVVGVAVAPTGYLTKMALHRRVQDPVQVRLRAEHPRYGQAYWTRITQWIDPHRVASLDAQVLPGNHIAVNLTNVARAELRPPLKWLESGDEVRWLVAGRRVTTPRDAENVYDVVIENGTPAVRAHVEKPAEKVRPYAPGSFMELYRGEPLIVVYGTQSADAAVSAAIRAMAEKAARFSCPGRLMDYGRAPLVADTDVTDAQLAAANVLLIGGAGENRIAARLMSRMPIREENGALRIFERETAPLRGRGYGFLYPNPEYPSRLVFVYASSLADFYRPREGEGGASFFFGEAGRDPFLPDLFVESVENEATGRCVRACAFTYGWQLVPTPEETVSRRPASLREFEAFRGEASRAATGAPFALVREPEKDGPCPYDPESCAWSDIALLLGQSPVAVAEISGADLLRLAATAEKRTLSVLPEPNPDAIGKATVYRVAATPEVFWGFTTLRYIPPRATIVASEDEYEQAARTVWGVRPATR